MEASARSCYATSKGSRSLAKQSSPGRREATTYCATFPKADSSMAGGRLMDRHQWHGGVRGEGQGTPMVGERPRQRLSPVSWHMHYAKRDCRTRPILVCLRKSTS